MPFLRHRASIGFKGFKLTPKMKSFIDEYLIDGNATEAVLRSDYKTKPGLSARNMAAELMAHPLVVEEIDRRYERKSQRAEVRSEYLVLKLMEIIEATSAEETTANRLRAIELAGKSIAMWKDRQEISGPGGEAIKHEQTIKENADSFTEKLNQLAERATDNVVSIR